jgi:hypothetical protein
VHFIHEDAGLHARVAIHNLPRLIHVSVKNARSTYVTAITDGAHDGKFTFRAKLEVSVVMLPYDLLGFGTLQPGATS